MSTCPPIPILSIYSILSIRHFCPSPRSPTTSGLEALFEGVTYPRFFSVLPPFFLSPQKYIVSTNSKVKYIIKDIFDKNQYVNVTA